jgi:spermidine/putrescine transport system permease protein
MASSVLFGKSSRALTAYAAGFALVLYLPILLIPLFSFNSGVYVRFPIEGFTWGWYRDLAARAPLHAAFVNSVQVGVVVALISTALAIPAAKAIARYRMPGKGPVVALIMLPLVVPGLIFGVAMLTLLNSMGVPRSLWTVAAGHVVLCLPFAIFTLLPRFEGYDRSLDEASADLGENGWWTFWRITLPMILPGVLASLLLTFTISFDEFILAFFLSGTQATLPMYIWSQLRFPQDFPSLLALATLILVFSFLMVFASLKISGFGRTTARGAAE